MSSLSLTDDTLVGACLADSGISNNTLVHGALVGSALIGNFLGDNPWKAPL